MASRKKPKRLNLKPEDRVVGIRARTQRDFLAGCNEPGKAWFNPDVHVFMKTFCRVCKNSDCIRAKGVANPWLTRMSEQVDYLLNDPQFSDLTSPEHIELAQQAFEDIGHKMQRLEIARARQDWEIPSDGYDRVADRETTDQFDDAVRKLAQARGKEVSEDSETGSDANAEQPAYFQSQQSDEPEEESEYEYDTHYPSETGNVTYHVALHKQGNWTCECKGFGRWKKCKHVDTVRSWYEEQLELVEAEQQAEQQAPPPKASPPDPRVPSQHPMNTPVPSDGVMVGGAPPPDRSKREPPVQREAEDPWAIRKEQKVEPGATVVLKGTKKSE